MGCLSFDLKKKLEYRTGDYFNAAKTKATSKKIREAKVKVMRNK